MHCPICLLKAALKREDCRFEKGRQDTVSFTAQVRWESAKGERISWGFFYDMKKAKEVWFPSRKIHPSLLARLARISICFFIGLILQTSLWSFQTQLSSIRHTTYNTPKGPLISFHNTTATWTCKDWNPVKNQLNILLAWLSEVNIQFPGTMKDATVLHLETAPGVHCLKSWRRFPQYFVADYMMNSLPQSMRDTGKLLTSSWLFP